jgi:hypothetical protein
MRAAQHVFPMQAPILVEPVVHLARLLQMAPQLVSMASAGRVVMPAR